MSLRDKDKLVSDLQSEITMLKSILYEMPGNVYWKAKEDYFLGCNNNHARVFNLPSPEAIIGKYSVEILPPELIERVREVDRKVIESETEMSFEERGINHFGKQAIYLSRKSPFYDDKGRLIGTLGVSIDITKQKRTEEKLKIARKKAEAANHAKSQFLAMISHELRNPLTSILGFAALLQKNDVAYEEQKIYIEYVIHSANYLLDLVNRLLDCTKLEADKTELVLERINLRKLIQDVSAMLNGSAKKKNLELCLQIDQDIPEEIIADSRILKQILINLIENAIKFTSVGGITLKVICIKKSEQSIKLEIIVEDTGIGIPSNKLKSIFKEFYQVNDVYTRNMSMVGTGLGLAIVRKLVKLMNGKIKVISELNKGSTFSIVSSFSLPSNHFERSTLDSHSLEIKKVSLQYPILLVEDDELVQIVHQKMLTNLGYHVDIAGNGKKALSMLNNNGNYCMIFVDIGLPDLNGFELIQTIRKKFSHLQHIPVIALTGFFTEEEKKKCIRAGAEQVLVKPVSQEVLKEALYKYTQVFE